MKSDERVARQIGFALRRIRERRDIRQYVVADLAGISKGMLSGYENGRHAPNLANLVRVLRALDCSAEEFGLHVGPWGSVRGEN
jgi:transcriptional regulator with XRE-family HTH domain